MLPVVTCLVALAALIVAEYADVRWAQALAKLGASTAFVWAALAWGAAQTPFGQLLLAGLCLCWVGDALLLSRGQTLWFQLGIGAFLLGHVFYAWACTRLSLPPLPLAACVTLAGLGAWRIHRWLIPRVPGDFRIPVVAYIGVISLMVALAVTAMAGGGPAALGIGAFGFALSDLSVARERFVASGFVNVAWGLPAYYLSQLAIAYAAGSP
jgi:uncharacterized membrane protein YhhN